MWRELNTLKGLGKAALKIQASKMKLLLSDFKKNYTKY